MFPLLLWFIRATSIQNHISNQSNGPFKNSFQKNVNYENGKAVWLLKYAPKSIIFIYFLIARLKISCSKWFQKQKMLKRHSSFARSLLFGFKIKIKLQISTHDVITMKRKDRLLFTFHFIFAYQIWSFLLNEVRVR